MFENLRLSFKGIWSHKMRSFLTMLGIIIGIAAIIAIVSTINGTNKQIEKNLIGSGDNNVTVCLYNGDWSFDFTWEGIPKGVPEISKETFAEIQEIDKVESASLFRERGDSNVYYLKTSLSGGKVVGVDEYYFDTAGYKMKEGRAFSAQEIAQGVKVAVIDTDAEKTLFQGEDAVGKTIEINKEPFVVIGVVTEKEAFEPTINSMEDYYMYAYESSSGNVFVAGNVWPVIYCYDEPQNIILRAESTKDMAAVGRATADLVNANLTTDSDEIKYKSEDVMEQAKQIQQLSQSTNMMLIWIAGISLLVGGIGVMNIMLVSVTERTGEIGLKKAIGARKSIILGQFLTEAVVLTSIGGLLGVLVGIILANIISMFNGIPISISAPAAILAVGFSMAIGIIFGILPSYKAANLDPIEALRRE